MSKLERKIETSANIAIIIVALSILGFGGYSYFQKNPEPETLTIGSKVSVPNINWAKNKQTLLLVLQKGCHFCSESAPFYQKLIKSDQIQKNTQIIAVLPNPPEDSKNYLKESGIEIAEVRQANLASIGVRGTPTLILANQQGEVLYSWIGKLNPADEEKVLQKISCNKTEGCA